MTGSAFVHRLRVRYHECDQQGHVFNAHYFTFFDIALTEAWREAIGPWAEVVDKGIDLVVAEARARYLAGAQFDDELELRWWIERLGTTAMSTRIDVVRDGTVLVEGEMRHVCVEAGSTAKTPIPDDVRAALAPYVVTP
jgi:acyl-CoA thioester hydrolase